jgi:predicted O-methyltransferase YrrM
VIENVTRAFPNLKYMTHAQAVLLRKIVLDEGLRDLLELGICHGKSTAYLAAILEEAGAGRLTSLDTVDCLRLSPNVHEVLSTLGLGHRVEVCLHRRSFTMVLLQMLEGAPRRSFDFCYFDAGHSWDVTGFGFLLVDRMLKPGGWVLFDDLDFTLDRYLRQPELAPRFHRHAPDEMTMRQVRKVFEVLVRDLGYRNLSEPRRDWGLARKPCGPQSR